MEQTTTVAPTRSRVNAVSDVFDTGARRLVLGGTMPARRAVAQLLNGSCGGDSAIILDPSPWETIREGEGQVQFSNDLYLRMTLGPGLASRLARTDVRVRVAASIQDIQAINRIRTQHGMPSLAVDRARLNQASGSAIHVVVTDRSSRRIVGCCSVVDHARAFRSANDGASVWALAKTRATDRRRLTGAMLSLCAERLSQRGRTCLDLAVDRSNRKAEKIYRDLGFRQIARPLLIPAWMAAPPTNATRGHKKQVLAPAAYRAVATAIGVTSRCAHATREPIQRRRLFDLKAALLSIVIEKMTREDRRLSYQISDGNVQLLVSLLGLKSVRCLHVPDVDQLSIAARNRTFNEIGTPASFRRRLDSATG